MKVMHMAIVRSDGKRVSVSPFTVCGYDMDDVFSTNQWKNVTCKHCLRKSPANAPKFECEKCKEITGGCPDHDGTSCEVGQKDGET